MLTLFILISLITTSIVLLFLKEHPQSSAKFMADDAIEIDVPKTGLEGKSIVVVGGGVSGLSASKYLLEAGAQVTLLEQRDIVGGNNDPYLEKGKHYATTVIVTYPSQQPHYLNLCRELGISQTPHDFSNLEGEIILKDRHLKIKMGAGFWTFLKYCYKQSTIKEFIDGLRILVLFYYQFKFKAETKKSIKDVLGERLCKSTAFTHVFMPWIGINTWCRFDDISTQPAHIFAAFIFEYALALKTRKKDYKNGENGWCVLDGRLIHKLEAFLLNNSNYNQKLTSKVSSVVRKNGKILVQIDKGIELECDKIIFATQPFQALSIIKNVAHSELIDELKKWPKMDCYVILHKDLRQIKKMPWIHQTHTHKKTNKYYITNTIKPIMSDLDFDCAITFVYNVDNYEDFVANHIDETKVIKVYEPKLPIFTLENSINRNDVWGRIDRQSKDVYWTHACKSGIQYHNNGILNAKRIVKTLIENN
jgi:predicted NAD/FAD-binding protein